MEKQSGRFIYYHSSCNCCGRYLEEPALITNRADFDRFLERIHESDILQWAITQRPNSDWVCVLVTNVTFFVNRILQHPIGCVGINLPTCVKRNKAILGLEKDHHSAAYRDNLCLFRCLALHLGREAAALYAEYSVENVHDFTGVTLDDLYRVETKFKTNVCVYKLVETPEEKTTAELVRRSLCHYPDTMYVNLYESHYSYIQDIGMYCHSYRCRKCGESLWKWPRDLHRHESVCEGGIRRIYPGGVYQPSPSVFQRLDDEGFAVIEDLRYYPYRATFDFECYFNDERLPPDSDRVQWSARHVPLSVSVASNVPGHNDAQCYVTNGDSDKLVEDMMAHLITISDAAYESLLPSYKDVLACLKERASVWDEIAATAHQDDQNEEKRVNPYKTLERQLQAWLHQLPVIGFNSSKYDLNTIKRFFVPLLIRNSDAEQASCFVIKRQNYFMCLSTNKLKFLDMANYLAPGVSYDKYLKAYGCDQQKGHFPYEYMDDLVKLDDCALPHQESFYSRLKNEGISDEDYALCQATWCDNGMKTMRDFLVWYNNRDVVPFLQAIHKQFAFYQQQNIDMFKEGISVPGLTLLYLFNNIPSKTYFAVFNKTNSDLHQLIKDNILGGPAMIFHRYHEKNVTKIRGEETCRSIVGYDANALYLWALMQDMPTGWYVRRREENGFRPQQAQPYGQMAVQWLSWESVRTGYSIRHQVNGREKRIGKLPVDGWCANTLIAYQFHGCFFHGCPKCYDDPEKTNSVNGKTMAELLANTKTHTAYLRCFVDVVEMWECEWKGKRIESDIKRFLDDEFPRRSTRGMTQHQIITAVLDGTLFGMVECDVCVPGELQDHFAEMQPIFKNTMVTRNDIGPFMRDYAEEHDIMTTPRRMLVGSYRGDKILLSTPLLQWNPMHGLIVDHVYQLIEY